AEDLAGDARVGDNRATDRGGIAVGDQEDPIEGDRVAGAAVEELDLELRPDLDAILLSAGLDDCVHGTPGRDGRRAAARRSRRSGNGASAMPGQGRGLYSQFRSSVNRRAGAQGY